MPTKTGGKKRTLDQISQDVQARSEISQGSIRTRKRAEQQKKVSAPTDNDRPSSSNKDLTELAISINSSEIPSNGSRPRVSRRGKKSSQRESSVIEVEDDDEEEDGEEVEDTESKIKSMKARAQREAVLSQDTVRTYAIDREIRKIQEEKDAEEEGDAKAFIDGIMIQGLSLPSIFSIVEKYPSSFKEFLDDFVQDKENVHRSKKKMSTGGINSNSVVIKIIFLYFFELIGILDSDTLSDLVAASTKVRSVTEWDRLLKDQKIEEKIDWNKAQLLPFDKEGLTHKRFLKRFCKIFMSNYIDAFPAREGLLETVLKQVCALSQSKVRLVRFGYTFIALGLLKQLLSQHSDIGFLVSQRTMSQVEVEPKNDELVEICLNLIKRCISTLGVEVIQQRGYDTQEFIRKIVIESLSQLSIPEFKVASENHDCQALDLLFESLRDDSAQVRKLALNTLSAILIKMNSKDPKTDLAKIERYFRKQSKQLVRLTQPTELLGSNAQPDPQVMLKAVQVLRRMYELISSDHLLPDSSVNKICNLCHFPDKKIQEEVGLFMCHVSDEIDDPSSLLDIQKFNLAKMNSKQQEGEEVKIEINFVNEPRKSKKQLLKLIRIVQTLCKSKAQIRLELYQDREEESGVSISGIDFQDKLKEEVKDSKLRELAQLLVDVYGRTTSVVYDIVSIVEAISQFSQESNEERESELVLTSNLLYFSLVQLFKFKDSHFPMKDFQVSFNEYWRLAKDFLTLKKLNDLIQPNRNSIEVVEPLLKSALILLQARAQDPSMNIEGAEDPEEQSAICEGFLFVLRDIVSNQSSDSNSVLIKLSVICMVKLKDLFPGMSSNTSEILKELIECQLEELKKFFKSQPEEPNQICSSTVNVETLLEQCRRFNDIMGSVSLINLISEEQVGNWGEFIISSVFDLTRQSEFVTQMSPLQLFQLLSLPLESMKQVFHKSKEASNISLLQLQVKLSSALHEHLLDLLEAAPIQNQPKARLQVFRQLINSLNIVCGDGNQGNFALYDLKHFARIQKTLVKMIQVASKPYVFNDEITFEFFSALLQFVSSNTLAFMDEIGHEFIINFVLKYHYTVGSVENTGGVGGKMISQIKKMLHFQKSRDSAVPFTVEVAESAEDQFKTPKKEGSGPKKYRSVFFTFLLRCVQHLCSDAKEDVSGTLLSYLHTTMADVQKEMAELSLDPSNKRLVLQFMKAKATQLIIKTSIQSVFFAVMRKKGDESMSAKEEELTYCQFVEDFLNFALLRFKPLEEEEDAPKRLEFDNLLSVMSIPQMMHGSFMNAATQAKVVKKVKDTITNLKPNQEEDESLEPMKKFVLGVLEKHTEKMESGAAANQKKKGDSRESRTSGTNGAAAQKKVASTKLGKKKGFAEKNLA